MAISNEANSTGNTAAAIEAIHNRFAPADEDAKLKDRIESLDSRKTGALYVSLIGMALLLASLASVKGQTLMIQGGIGLLVMVAGGIPYFYLGSRIKTLSKQLKQ